VILKAEQYGIGTFATYLSRDWKNVAPVPEGVSAATAAAALTQGLTAITFMNEAYNVQKGDTVFVHTVAGGLGLLFAQYAKLRGATVIGTTSTKEKAELAKKAGADHVILYKDEDVVKRTLEITEGKGVHAVFDGVGKDTYVSADLFANCILGLTCGTALTPTSSFSAERVLWCRSAMHLVPSPRWLL
jgi:NADPH2:quinone reductase